MDRYRLNWHKTAKPKSGIGSGTIEAVRAHPQSFSHGSGALERTDGGPSSISRTEGTLDCFGIDLPIGQKKEAEPF